LISYYYHAYMRPALLRFVGVVLALLSLAVLGVVFDTLLSSSSKSHSSVFTVNTDGLHPLGVSVLIALTLVYALCLLAWSLAAQVRHRGRRPPSQLRAAVSCRTRAES
jgi:hypothetical protein